MQDSSISNIQKNPLKLYIQDIFRANSTDNKYIYKLFGLPFKNVMIHGVLTAVYNTTKITTNLELSDATGTVQIYYDSTKNNNSISSTSWRDLTNNYIDASKFGDPNILIMSEMMDRIKNKMNCVVFEEGCFMSVVGDIFVDSSRGVRMISAYECNVTSAAYDVVWMEELRYLYDKFYINNPSC
ncbi:uncharacterized protein LOC113515866 [Galleria mellonella]|uniref:Uncharacterized protein LOC113515866 n=1 Tax=Galleria mellonella TaxID=7137 RepID=A0A6J1WTV4_GALME|nr:uncharacterized protein LOC113515866 [Galleria mellonella]